MIACGRQKDLVSRQGRVTSRRSSYETIRFLFRLPDVRIRRDVRGRIGKSVATAVWPILSADVSRFVGLACAVALAAVSCSSPSPSPLTTAPPTASPIVALSEEPSAAPSQTAAFASPTPVPADVAALLANPNRSLYLAPLASDHTALVDVDTAIAAARRTYNVTGPVVYVGHGLHPEPVWLVIVKVQDMAPMPVGPGCPSPSNGCYRHWAVGDYVVAFISDQSGESAGGGFTTLKEAFPPPSVPAQ
jgi:hypothetical protein